MSPDIIGLIGLVLMLILFAIGMPISFAMAFAGVAGYAYLVSPEVGFSLLPRDVFEQFASYPLSVIPMFVLMGCYAFAAGIGKKLFETAHVLFGHMPGGLAMAGILTSAGFAATSGSSVATAATVGSVALPEMRRAGYDPALAAGSVAAGGVLGVLIPPSVLLIFYAALTEVSAGKMLVAGFVPGILTTIVFMLGIRVIAGRTMQRATLAPRSGWGERLSATTRAWQVVVLFVVVLGGIYLGLMTPTEAAAVGAVAALLMLLGELRLGVMPAIVESFRSTITTTVMILFTMLGAGIFSYFLTLVQLPQQIAGAIGDSGIPPHAVVALLLLAYIPLGMFLDAFSMMVITLPIMFPTVQQMGFDPIWFGILCVKMCEIGLMTPPVGLNCFVIAGIDRQTPLTQVFRGAMWFVLMEMLTVTLLFAFPAITTFLPNMMLGR